MALWVKTAAVVVFLGLASFQAAIAMEEILEDGDDDFADLLPKDYFNQSIGRFLDEAMTIKLGEHCPELLHFLQSHQNKSMTALYLVSWPPMNLKRFAEMIEGLKRNCEIKERPFLNYLENLILSEMENAILLDDDFSLNSEQAIGREAGNKRVCMSRSLLFRQIKGHNEQ